MQKRTLGQGLQVSVMGLGCMGMSSGYGTPPPREEMIELLHHALDLGVTFFDTAEVYGVGHNEELLGEAFQGRRDQVVIATKFCWRLDHDKRQQSDERVRPDEVTACLEGSLRRLRTDHVDLYYQHRMHPEIAVEEYVGVLKDLVAQGKIGHYGLSEPSAATLRRAHAVHPVTAVQSEYSLWWRRPEQEVLPACEELGVGFVPFSPLGRGFLTGELASGSFGEGDMRASLPRFQDAEMQANQRLVELVREVADTADITPGQAALAWLLSRKPWIVPIPGTTRLSRLKENVHAAEVEVGDEELDRLTALLEQAPVAGDRYDAQREAATNL